MSGLRRAIRDYLTLRRSLGFKVERYDHYLTGFIAHLESHGQRCITAAAALQWTTQLGASPKTKATRLSAVRKFAEYVRTLDPRTEVPAPDLLPCRNERPIPHLYTPADIRALLNAARQLRGFRADTYSALIGLLAVTGMRRGEALALDRQDFDERQGVVLIRKGKFGKSRLVPLHRTTVVALRAYALKRDQAFPRPRSLAFFLSQAGTRLLAENVWYTSMRLRRWTGLLGPRGARPRLHDLRHSFAVQTLIEWYRSGVDVQARLPILATYLGHVSPSSTYWYLTATPELVSLAAQRLEKKLGGLP
jgi:integrase